MCGRYTIRTAADRLAAAFEAGFDEFSEIKITPRFNVAPSQHVPLVAMREGQRVMTMATWGFVPVWSKDPDPKVKPINAKSETVATSGMFRTAFKGSRCLLPADGFYEWKAGPTTKSPKTPIFFRRRDDAVFAFAGLRGRDGTCLHLTTTPNSVVAPVHNRMPVMLHPADFARWLDEEADPDDLTSLLRPYPDDELVARQVSTRVNRPAIDDPSLLDEV